MSRPLAPLSPSGLLTPRLRRLLRLKVFSVLLHYILGCTACKEIHVTFKGGPKNGHQNKKLGYYTIDGVANGRDMWKSTKNANGLYYIWFSKLFRKWAIGNEHEKDADINQGSSIVNNQVLAGIVSKENFLECPFDLKSEKWIYYGDLGMTRAEEIEINVTCTKLG